MTRRNLDAALFVWAVAIAATAIWDGVRVVMTEGWQR